MPHLKPHPTYRGVHQPEPKLNDCGADIVVALVQMCNMQAKVHAGLDERLCSEFKSISLIELSHTNVAHEDFQKGGKENLSGVVNLLGGCKTARSCKPAGNC